MLKHAWSKIISCFGNAVEHGVLTERRTAGPAPDNFFHGLISQATSTRVPPSRESVGPSPPVAPLVRSSVHPIFEAPVFRCLTPRYAFFPTGSSKKAGLSEEERNEIDSAVAPSHVETAAAAAAATVPSPTSTNPAAVSLAAAAANGAVSPYTMGGRVMSYVDVGRLLDLCGIARATSQEPQQQQQQRRQHHRHQEENAEEACVANGRATQQPQRNGSSSSSSSSISISKISSSSSNSNSNNSSISGKGTVHRTLGDAGKRRDRRTNGGNARSVEGRESRRPIAVRNESFVRADARMSGVGGKVYGLGGDEAAVVVEEDEALLRRVAGQADLYSRLLVSERENPAVGERPAIERTT